MDISICGSDLASSCAYGVIDAMVKVLRRELEEEPGNAYNTSGVINVALFFEEIIVPNRQAYHSEALVQLASDTLELLEKNELSWAHDKSLWTDEEGRLDHLARYKELQGALKLFVATHDE